ncbi:MAG: hypothetical protein A2046_03895 [Bacteroidetes bacterium GWA2_30_7]|nr:MAG: hypothetical protein A2046_03895 [Bacteroidetes bacterium GWA2_30_7]
MKFIYTTLIIFSAFFNTYSQSKATIAMSINQVKKIYPNMESATYEKTITLSRTENLYGIEGEWGYRFKNDTLNWIHFDKYIDEINDTNFRNCLSATRKIIADFTKVYGNPDTTITGDTSFIDPYQKKHWGYDVIEAQWKNYNGMKIKVEFTFMGGKGEYHFLVKINYFDKNYPYYD